MPADSRSRSDTASRGRPAQSPFCVGMMSKVAFRLEQTAECPSRQAVGRPKLAVKTHPEFPEADFQVRRAANDGKATCSGRTAAER
jgi:hypothetical protein